MRTLALTLAALLPSAVPACPTAADLSTGIMIDSDDGATETFRRLRDDLVRIEQSFGDGIVAVMDVAHGTYILSYMDADNGAPDPGSRVTTSYPGGMGALTPPEAGQRLTFETMVMDSGGPYAETVTIAWGDPAEVQIGDCSYTAIDGLIAYSSDGDFFSEGYRYLPDLGFAYLISYEDSAGRDDYVAVAIRAE